MSEQVKISDFSPHLFWDVNAESLDWEKNKAQIIQRVLEYGLIHDWNILKEYYGIERIGEVCRDLRSLDAKSVNFISVLTGIPKESFRCYILKQSIPPHWNS